MTRWAVHWVDDRRLHGHACNNAWAVARTTVPAEVTCARCLTAMARRRP